MAAPQQLMLQLPPAKPHANKTRSILLAYLSAGEWFTPFELSQKLRFVGDICISDSNLTARLREMRRPEFGGHNIVSRPRAGSTAWEYKLQ